MIIATVGFGITTALVAAFHVVGALVSFFVVFGSLFFGVYFVLCGLVIFVGELADGT
ncbi:hypothetical protein [Haladaptatus sp. DFWS20]|uniref:hypothetical protein n=1 Tax=Haladaptatus sp. DFWS20 TaxID=3403467 RepID=UPI003EBC046F